LFAQSNDPASEVYFDGYQAWKAGEKLEKEGDKQGALQKYLEAYKAIGSVAQNFPTWQPEVVSYRLKNVEQSLTRLGYTVPTSAVPTSSALPPVSPPPSMSAVPAMPPATGNPLEIINQQFQSLQQQNEEMRKKLKLYEDGYLKSLEERQKADQAVTMLKQQSQELSLRMDELTKMSAAKDAASQAELRRVRDESKMVSDMLASKEKQLTSSSQAIATLQQERDALRSELATAKSAGAMPRDSGTLQAENTRLKQELDSARKQVEALRTEGVRKDSEIATLKEQITGVQSEIARLRQENTAYQTKVADLTVRLKGLNQDLTIPTGAPVDPTVARENQALRAIIMRHLRQEERQRQTKELVIAEMKKLEVSSKSLMENLEDMTSGKVRITVDEEALFSEPELREILAANGVTATLQATSTKAKSGKARVTVPVTYAAGVTPEEKLMVQADAALQSQDYSGAAKNLQDALRANPKNTTALLSLAGIKLNERKHDEAEVLLQKCLVYEAENSQAHYRLGVCYFQQGKLTEATASFEKTLRKPSESAARAHHYLGIIASKLSNPAKAEAEFKSALAIDPSFGDAHFNLAVLYATSDPPDFEKAREHYAKALGRGIPKDAGLEKLLQNVNRTAAR
ncbi:MAG: tetratricopeptide repeat protein, partial [Roseimicrobium sp.]